MSSPLLIFISHSSEDNEFTQQLCQALRAKKLEEDGTKYHYEVLVDMDELQAGKPWPKQLHVWMARCHAAILLLSSNAIQSDWVLKEATILAWRLALDKNFRFFIIPIDDVRNTDLEEAGFAPLRLEEIQHLTSGNADAIATEVSKVMGIPLIHNTTPYDRLCGTLEDLLQSAEGNTLRDIFTDMELQPPKWKSDVDERYECVRVIAKHLLREDLGGYECVADLVDRLMPTISTETVEKILHVIAPHWVDAQAAGRIPSLAISNPRYAIAMNGACVSEYTAAMYVRRAYPLSYRQSVLPIAGGNSGSIVDHVTRELYLLKHRDEDPDETLSAKELADVIKDFSKGKPRHFVVIPTPHPSDTELKELMKRFPKLTFILWTGEELKPIESDAVLPLNPPVDIDMEEQQRDDYEEAIEIIHNF